ncbi:sensor histidine kinase [Gracilimonas amylolytica]|uniref:sensor histidine kinase n=1 Tax=Gracilimonas amylolytica TaxID=1749045 RepID=UPI000CD97031|nr:histidine kinase dimerization/phosphoacceptor domain -containing protein [Gracilimonas amylolytica]
MEGKELNGVTSGNVYQPLTMDYILGEQGIGSLKFLGLLTVWVALIAVSISSVFIVENYFGFSDILNQDKIGQVFLIQIPMLIGMLLMFWVGFEWGFIPVFVSTFVLAFTASMTWYWSLLYSFSFTLGLSIFALSYYCVSFDLSLKDLRSFTFYIVVSLFAALACSLGAFVWSRFYNLPLFETLLIWKSWWVSLFLQSVLVAGPILYFFTPMVYRFRSNKFNVPEKEEVSLKWIYSTITVVVLVLAMFIISAKLLGSQSIESEIMNSGLAMGSELYSSISSVNESFEIVTWISISLVFFIGIGSIYLVGSWNKNLKDEVDSQTQVLRLNEVKLNAALDERDELLNEIHNRVRTNLTMVLAVLELQLKSDTYKTNEQILKDSHSLIRSLTIVHESMSQTKSASQVDLKNYAIKLSNRVEQSLRKDKKDIQFTVKADEGITLDMDRAIPFSLITNELVMNACNHGFKTGDKGSVVIDISKDDETITLKVSNNGQGLPSNFENKASSGIGMRIIRAFSKQLNAELDYFSTNVTTFILKIPVD